MFFPPPPLNKIFSFPPLVRTTPIRFIITTESYTSPALPSNWPRYVTSWHRTRSVVASFNADKPPLLPFHAVTFLVNLRLFFFFFFPSSIRFCENRACPNPTVSAGCVSALISRIFFSSLLFPPFLSDYVISRNTQTNESIEARSINLFTFSLQSLSYYCNYYTD